MLQKKRMKRNEKNDEHVPLSMTEMCLRFVGQLDLKSSFVHRKCNEESKVEVFFI